MNGSFSAIFSGLIAEQYKEWYLSVPDEMPLRLVRIGGVKLLRLCDFVVCASGFLDQNNKENLNIHRLLIYIVYLF